MGRRLAMLVALLLVLCTVACTSSQKPRPFAFGLIADIQYGDKDTRGSRHYRASLGKLEECVEDLNGRDLAFTIQVGDIIDGRKEREDSVSDLERIAAALERLSMPVYHVVGNHCLAAGRETLEKVLRLDRAYYDFTVPEAPGYRFVVLDGNDAGYGVYSDHQTEWLRTTLEAANDNNERVIIFSHFPLLRSPGGREGMKETPPVLDVISGSDTVVAFFAGHHHSGGYVLDGSTHHVTVKGMVETADTTAYAVVNVLPDRLEEIGFGAEPSRQLNLVAVQP